MNKPSKRDALNLIFSAALILLYIVCSYFFLTLATSAPDIEPYINTLVFVMFGLVVFYATRVGEGKAVKRFSLWTLIVLDIPALYIILAQLVPSMPLHTQIANLGGLNPIAYSPLFILACIALGYGLPYTFLSGFEAKSEDETAPEAEAAEDSCTCEACGCGYCDTTKGEYTLCDEFTEGAKLVVDDYDTAFNADKEIKLSDVTPCSEDLKVGAYVVYTESESTAEVNTAEAE